MRAKKSLGQNFLTNKKILLNIIRAAEISKKDVILEVGPGKGSLTELLVKSAKKIIAVEKDHELVKILHEKFKNEKNIEIIEGDILKLNPRTLGLVKYKIVANIPYYITSHFLKIFLEGLNKPTSMTLMVQHEVARRICARQPDMNLLALSVQVFGKPKYIRKVSRNFFHPAPNVDSAIITISDISDRWFLKNKIDQKKFFSLLRQAFGQKRKMLRKSLGIKNTNFDTKRPEELSLNDWLGILKS